MVTEGSKHLMNDENFGLIMNPSQTILISNSHKALPQDLVALDASTPLVCPAGAR